MRKEDYFEEMNHSWFEAISFAVFCQSMILMIVLVVNFEHYDWTMKEISRFFIQLMLIGGILSVVYYKFYPVYFQWRVRLGKRKNQKKSLISNNQSVTISMQKRKALLGNKKSFPSLMHKWINLYKLEN